VSESKPSIEVAIALVWRAGRVLVTRRPAGVHLAGFWEFPGGKLAPGETAEAGAVREVLEEVGMVARAQGLRPPITWEYPERRVTLYPVDCDWIEGDGTARGVAELRFVERHELATLDFPEANAALVSMLVTQGRGR
jgi:8-oxo-dGTP diphosphatase